MYVVWIWVSEKEGKENGVTSQLRLQWAWPRRATVGPELRLRSNVRCCPPSALRDSQSAICRLIRVLNVLPPKTLPTAGATDDFVSSLCTQHQVQSESAFLYSFTTITGDFVARLVTATELFDQRKQERGLLLIPTRKKRQLIPLVNKNKKKVVSVFPIPLL